MLRQIAKKTAKNTFRLSISTIATASIYKIATAGAGFFETRNYKNNNQLKISTDDLPESSYAPKRNY